MVDRPALGSTGNSLILPKRRASITGIPAYKRNKASEPRVPGRGGLPKYTKKLRNFDTSGLQVPNIKMPKLRDVDGRKAWQGVLAGVVVGTFLSLGFSVFKSTFVAGVVAAGVSLLPKVDIEAPDLEDEGPELIGVAAAGAVNEGEKALSGEEAIILDEATTATVATSSLSAGFLVSLFAAKSLGIVLASAASVYAIKKNEDVDIKVSTVEGRDFLRTRGGSAPGVAASLVALQAKRAFLVLKSAAQGMAAPAEEVREARRVRRGVPFQQPLPAASGKVEGSGALGVQQPPMKAAAAPPQQTAPQSFAQKQEASSSEAGEGMLAEAMRARQQAPSPTPLQTMKGGDSGSSAKDLATGPPSLTPSDPVLTPAAAEGASLPKAATEAAPSALNKSSPGATPLEKLKGGSAEVGSGSLATGASTFKAAAPEKSDSGQLDSSRTPLENVKGKGTAADSLLGSEVAFKSGAKTSLLNEEASAPSPSGSPLEKLKGSSSPPAGKPSASVASSQPSTPSLGSASDRDSQQKRSSLQIQQTGGLGKDTPSPQIAASGQPAAATSSPTPSPPPARRQKFQPLQIPSLKMNTAGSAAGAFAAKAPTAATDQTAAAKKQTPQQQARAASALAGGGLPQQKRTLAEKLLLLFGGGVVGGLLALLWLLAVQGAAISDALPKLLLAAVFACLLAIVLTANFIGRPSPAAA